MKPSELRAVTDGVSEFIRGYVGSAMEWTAKRLKALEDRIEAIPSGKDGKDGKDADPTSLKAEMVPELLAFVEAHIEQRISAIPIPKNGRDAPSAETIVQAMMPAIQKHLDQIPPPKDGKDGEPGKSLAPDDILPFLKSMQAEWALDFERRAQALFQKAVDDIPKPKDGKDGADGIGWDNMTVEHDGKRTVTLKWVKGETEVSAPVVFPCNIDAGFYKEGTQYEQGDGVTFGGSYWIAQKATGAKPEVNSEDWRLAVRKGRDGKRD